MRTIKLGSKFAAVLTATSAIAVLITAGQARSAVLHYGYPIRVASCDPRPSYYDPGFYPHYYPYGYYGYGGPAMLAIEYANTTSTPARVVEFGLVAHKELLAEVRDVGTFSPNITIKHEFEVSPNIFPIGTAFAQCVALFVEFQDGTHWQNPHLHQLRRSMYPGYYY
jgi:hypothetical protein